jgi:hypothetical protein
MRRPCSHVTLTILRLLKQAGLDIRLPGHVLCRAIEYSQMAMNGTSTHHTVDVSESGEVRA